MKVLFYRYNSICEPDIMDVFREMGLDVLPYTTEMTKKDQLPSVLVKQVSDFLLEIGIIHL